MRKSLSYTLKGLLLSTISSVSFGVGWYYHTKVDYTNLLRRISQTKQEKVRVVNLSNPIIEENNGKLEGRLELNIIGIDQDKLQLQGKDDQGEKYILDFDKDRLRIGIEKIIDNNQYKYKSD